MAGFWTWFVRVPTLLFGAASIAAGYAEVMDWSPALAFAMVLGMVSEAARRLAALAAERAERKRLAMAPPKEPLVFQPRQAPANEQRRAA